MKPTVLLLLVLCCACGPELKRYTYQEPKMGSMFSITLFAADSLMGRKAAYRAFQRIDEINRALSDYSEESETWQINANPTREWVPIGGDLLQVLLISSEVAEQTGGAFDPTIGNLVQLWRRARRKQQLPPSSEIAGALSRGGLHNVEIDSGRTAVRFLVQGVKLDFGGIGKGYAMDEALESLNKSGFEKSFVSASSSIAAGETPPGKSSWEFVMANVNENEKGVKETIRCSNCFIASSGDLYQYMELEGRRYSHIIDPSSGEALTNGAFAIVIAGSATLADAYATAFCVMSLKEIETFLQENASVHAKVWRNEGGELSVMASKGFDRYIKSP